MANTEPAPLGWNKVIEPVRGPMTVDLRACLSMIVSLAFSLSPLTSLPLSDELVILEGYSVWHEGAVTDTL